MSRIEEDDITHELTVAIGQLAALKYDVCKLEADEIHEQLDVIIEGLRTSRNNVANLVTSRDLTPEMTRLAELGAQLPLGLHSDWDGTNHFELTTPGGDEYWWLMVGDGIEDVDNPCESQVGKRLGLLMDIAAEVSRLYGHLKTSGHPPP